MGNKRKAQNRYRPAKRAYRGNQFCASSVSSQSDFSESEAPQRAENDDLLVFSDLSDSDAASQDEAATSESEESDDDEIEQDRSAGNRIVSLSCLQELISKSSVCSSCRRGGLKLEEATRQGLASELRLVCDRCDAETCEAMAEKTVQMKYFDINRKSVLAMRVAGRAREALTKICGVLDVPPPVSSHSFLQHSDHLHEAAKQIAHDSMRVAAAQLVDDGNAPVDIAVTTDGTWMKRGFTSLYGVQTCISWNTGKVLDEDILSKHCSLCERWSTKQRQGKVSAADYDAWHAGHLGDCHINTTVSSPSMETEAVKKIRSRSLEQYNLRYTTYIGDGDSKGHTAVQDMKVYGEDVTVVKEECVGHIQKRIGKNLRDLKHRLGSTKLSDGKAIGGRGRLTDALIDSLQNYYGQAVRNHPGSITDMAQAIWASFCHTFSTDQKPRHDFCPKGDKSWCGWQRSQVTGEPFSHKHSLSSAIFDQVKPIYIHLSDRPLLERCKRGATQNANESLNGLIWQMCPKQSFCISITVETAAFLAVITFNDGYSKLEAVLQKMGCSTGTYTGKALAELDRVKAYNKARKSSAAVQQARKRRRAKKKGFSDTAREKEGVTYTAGGF